MTSCIKIIKGSLFLGLRSLFFWDLCFCCNHRNVPFPSENQISYHNLFVCHLYLHQFLMIASLTPFRFFIPPLHLRMFPEGKCRYYTIFIIRMNFEKIQSYKRISINFVSSYEEVLFYHSDLGSVFLFH